MSIQINIKHDNGTITIINMIKPFITYKLKDEINLKLNIKQKDQILYKNSKKLEEYEIFILENELNIYSKKPIIIDLRIKYNKQYCLLYYIDRINPIFNSDELFFIKKDIHNIFSIPLEDILYSNWNNSEQCQNISIYKSITDNIYSVIELFTIPLITIQIQIDETIYITKYYKKDTLYQSDIFEILKNMLILKLNTLFINKYKFDIIINTI